MNTEQKIENIFTYNTKYVEKLFEVVWFNLLTVTICITKLRMKSCSNFLHILAAIVHFTDQDWISKSIHVLTPKVFEFPLRTSHDFNEIFDRGVIRILSNICDGAFCKNIYWLLIKSSIIDVIRGPKYALFKKLQRNLWIADTCGS